MDWLVMIVLAGAAALGWWWWRRRQPTPVEDEWVLPPEGPGVQLPGVAAAEGREVLDRDALLRGRAAFDPTAWDGTPEPDDEATDGHEAEGEPDAEDFPRFFDREYLERRAREREEP